MILSDANKNPGRARLLAPMAALATVLLAGPSFADYRFSGVDRVVALSDVHGAYDSMIRTLTSAAVIDDKQSWIGGTTHLVITGDLLDRGPDSREVMDLVMRLETEAAASGGEVHQLLGNHEVMNLVGDLRYVSRSEYAAFAEDESAEERENWFRHYWKSLPDAPAESLARAEFDAHAPPGFFAHRRAFRSDGKYGQWLLQKPLLIVIDDTAYVHGGVSPMMADFGGLDGLNDRLSKELNEYVRRVEELNDSGVLNPLDNFYDHPGKLQLAASRLEQPETMAEMIEAFTGLHESDIHNPNGPLWYRGTVGCTVVVERDRLTASLDSLGANRVVIGHTPTLTRRILQRMNGKIIEIDTGMLASSYAGSGNALLLEGDVVQVINEASPERLSVTPHPRRVGIRADEITSDDLQRILAHDDVLSTEKDESGRTIVSFQADGDVIKAVFTKNPRKNFAPDLAAYRLDLALQLDMVPVTVAREIDGQYGTLQFLPAESRDEVARSATRRGASAWCPLPVQWSAMYVFDVLIYNPGRPLQNMLYSPDNWQLMLVGHVDSFSTKRGRPAYLKQQPLEVGDAWRDALTALDDAALEEQFAGVLDSRRIKALANRRDELLE